MPAMTMDQILERVKELKADLAEKDLAMGEQQSQIHELELKLKAADDLERKLKAAEDRCAGLQQEVIDLKGSEAKAEEILDKLSDMLG